MDEIEIVEFGKYSFSEEFIGEAAEKGFTTQEYLAAIIAEVKND